MAKSTRQWIERDWTETTEVLRADDIQYDVTYTIKGESDRKPYSQEVRDRLLGSM